MRGGARSGVSELLNKERTFETLPIAVRRVLDAAGFEEKNAGRLSSAA